MDYSLTLHETAKYIHRLHIQLCIHLLRSASITTAIRRSRENLTPVYHIECGMMIRTPCLIGHPFLKSRRSQGFKLGRQPEHEAVTPIRKFGCPSLFRQRDSRGRASNREGTIIRTVGMIIRTVVFTRTGKLFPLMLLHQNEARSVSSSNSKLTKKGGHPWP